MDKKKKAGLQIRFNPESEEDIIEFLSHLKKAEVHLTAVSAFRTYMKSIGYYEKSLLEKFLSPATVQRQEISRTQNTESAAAEEKGVFDRETFKTLNLMFDNENDLKD